LSSCRAEPFGPVIDADLDPGQPAAAAAREQVHVVQLDIPHGAMVTMRRRPAWHAVQHPLAITAELLGKRTAVMIAWGRAENAWAAVLASPGGAPGASLHG